MKPHGTEGEEEENEDSGDPSKKKAYFIFIYIPEKRVRMISYVISAFVFY